MKPVPYLFDNLFSWLQKNVQVGIGPIDLLPRSGSVIRYLEIFTDPEHWITGTHLII